MLLFNPLQIDAQAYDDSELLPIYIKVGNDATNAEMRSEMQFLEQKNIFATFKVPELIETSYLKEKNGRVICKTS